MQQDQINFLNSNVRVHAPFRIGLAGGGSDVSPYCDDFGGAVLNATIDLFARVEIYKTTANHIQFVQLDTERQVQFSLSAELDLIQKFELQIGVYNYMFAKYGRDLQSFRLESRLDVPSGSGLGTSSTLVVALVAAFARFFDVQLSKMELATEAFFVERVVLNMRGGRQDQFAAAYGGFNFIRFGSGIEAEVESLEISPKVQADLKSRLLLFYMNTSRESSGIIAAQQENIRSGNAIALEATHQLKSCAHAMRLALLAGDFKTLGQLLDESWNNKKKLSDHISNPRIDEIYANAISLGALGGKISGAGGGGFMLFFVEPENAESLIEGLENLGAKHFAFNFEPEGVRSWLQ